MNRADAIARLSKIVAKPGAAAVDAARLHSLTLVDIAESLVSIQSILATGLGKGSPIPEVLKRLEAMGASPKPEVRRPRGPAKPEARIRRARDLLTDVETRLEEDEGAGEPDESARRSIADLTSALWHVLTLVEAGR